MAVTKSGDSSDFDASDDDNDDDGGDHNEHLNTNDDLFIASVMFIFIKVTKGISIACAEVFLKTFEVYTYTCIDIFICMFNN